MSVMRILEEVRALSLEERKTLMKLMIDTLTEGGEPRRTRSLRELRGLGKEIWQGIDAQQHIDQQRDEWDRE
jgi:hypothetical protein